MSDKHDPMRVADVLRSWLATSGLDTRLARAGVVQEWPDRVGPAIAAATTPLRVSGTTLVVAVRSSAWLSELSFMERRIVQHLNAGRTDGRIDRIRFVMAAGPGSRTESDTGA
jgi:predicted nucleic acid-binding Zn ribbon protein